MAPIRSIYSAEESNERAKPFPGQGRRLISLGRPLSATAKNFEAPTLSQQIQSMKSAQAEQKLSSDNYHDSMSHRSSKARSPYYPYILPQRAQLAAAALAEGGSVSPSSYLSAIHQKAPTPYQLFPKVKSQSIPSEPRRTPILPKPFGVREFRPYQGCSKCSIEMKLLGLKIEKTKLRLDKTFKEYKESTFEDCKINMNAKRHSRQQSGEPRM